MIICLTDEELIELTKRRRRAAQIRALQEMGIPIRAVRLDGSPVVLRSALEPAKTGSRQRPDPEPDYSAVSSR